MALPIAYELHVARELATAGGGIVVVGGVIGGLIGAANPDQDGWEPSARSGLLWGCVVAFVFVLILGSSKV